MRSLATAALACGVLLCAGCDRLFTPGATPFHAADVTGAAMGGDFRLRDPEGRERRLEDFRGKVVVLVFGYTRCPDVCPTTLADFAAAMQRLGADARDVQVVFVTVDPKRDTPDLLRQYVGAFNPGFLALRGDEAATAQMARDFHLYVQERPGSSPDAYTVDHSAQSLVFDRQGKLRLMIAYGMAPTDIASDLRVLLNS